MTTPHRCLPVPSLADWLPEVIRGSPGATAPQQLPPPQQVPGAGSPPQAGIRREEGTAGPGAVWEGSIPAHPAWLLQPYLYWGGEARLSPSRLVIVGLVPLHAWASQHPQRRGQKACRRHGRSTGSAKALQRPEDMGSSGGHGLTLALLGRQQCVCCHPATSSSFELRQSLQDPKRILELAPKGADCGLDITMGKGVSPQH